MANHKDALKRNRQNERLRQHNRHYKSRMRSNIKALNTLIEQGDKEAAATQLKQTVAIIQRVCQKGIIHRRQAARRVSRLTKAVNSIGA